MSEKTERFKYLNPNTGHGESEIYSHGKLVFSGVVTCTDHHIISKAIRKAEELAKQAERWRIVKLIEEKE